MFVVKSLEKLISLDEQVISVNNWKGFFTNIFLKNHLLKFLLCDQDMEDNINEAAAAVLEAEIENSFERSALFKFTSWFWEASF